MAKFQALVEQERWGEAFQELILNVRRHGCSPMVGVRAMKLLWTDPAVPSGLLSFYFDNLTTDPYELLMDRLHFAHFHRGGRTRWESMVDEATVEALSAFLSVHSVRLSVHSFSHGSDCRQRPLDLYKGAIDFLWRDVVGRGGLGAIVGRHLQKELLAIHSLEDLEDYPRLEEIWNKTELLLKAALKRNIQHPSLGGKPWLVTHAIAAVDCHCLLLWLAMRLYPDQVRMRDYLGRLPLHLAVSHPLKEACCFEESLSEELMEANQPKVSLLLDRFPEGARCADASGRVPLRVALDAFESLTNHADIQLHQTRVIEPLVELAPGALEGRDPVSRFFPYQQAAAKGAPVSTIFGFLLRNPAALQARRRMQVELDYEKLMEEYARVKQENFRLCKRLKELEMKCGRDE